MSFIEMRPISQAGHDAFEYSQVKIDSLTTFVSYSIAQIYERYIQESKFLIWVRRDNKWDVTVKQSK